MVLNTFFFIGFLQINYNGFSFREMLKFYYILLIFDKLLQYLLTIIIFFKSFSLAPISFNPSEFVWYMLSIWCVRIVF